MDFPRPPMDAARRILGDEVVATVPRGVVRANKEVIIGGVIGRQQLITAMTIVPVDCVATTNLVPEPDSDGLYWVTTSQPQGTVYYRWTCNGEPHDLLLMSVPASKFGDLRIETNGMLGRMQKVVRVQYSTGLSYDILNRLAVDRNPRQMREAIDLATWLFDLNDRDLSAAQQRLHELLSEPPAAQRKALADQPLAKATGEQLTKALHGAWIVLSPAG